MRRIHWHPEHIKRILVIKMRYIGDTVLVTPLLRALKTAVPLAKLYFLVTSDTADILKNQSVIDHVISFDNHRKKRDMGYLIRFAQNLRRFKVDMVMDLTRNDRSALFTFISGAPIRLGYKGAGGFQKKAYTHEVPYHFGTLHTVDHHLEMAAALGIPVTDRHPHLEVMASAQNAVRQTLQQTGVSGNLPFVLIHPGARRWYKSWARDRFSRLADRIMDHYPVQIVLSGGPQDQEACKTIAAGMRHPIVDMSGKIPLPLLPALIREARVLIGNDSAPIHIATAVHTPVIALFGPTRWEDWQPRRKQDTTLGASFDCRPCGHALPDCPRGDACCMSEITEEAVWDAVKGQLET